MCGPSGCAASSGTDNVAHRRCPQPVHAMLPVWRSRRWKHPTRRTRQRERADDERDYCYRPPLHSVTIGWEGVSPQRARRPRVPDGDAVRGRLLERRRRRRTSAARRHDGRRSQRAVRHRLGPARRCCAHCARPARRTGCGGVVPAVRRPTRPVTGSSPTTFPKWRSVSIPSSAASEWAACCSAR